MSFIGKRAWQDVGNARKPCIAMQNARYESQVSVVR